MKPVCSVVPTVLPLYVSIETELLLELKIHRFVLNLDLFETCANCIKTRGEFPGILFYWQLVESVCFEAKEGTMKEGTMAL